MSVEDAIRAKIAEIAALEQACDEAATVSVIGDDGNDYVVGVRLLARFARNGQPWVRWEPVEILTGALAFYNNWSKGALTLPATRVIV